MIFQKDPTFNEYLKRRYPHNFSMTTYNPFIK